LVICAAQITDNIEFYIFSAYFVMNKVIQKDGDTHISIVEALEIQFGIKGISKVEYQHWIPPATFGCSYYM
jgi:hypothetical protein